MGQGDPTIPDTSITNDANSHTGSKTGQTASKASGKMCKAIIEQVRLRA